MPTNEFDRHGIAVLDIHDDRWAVWQVSTASMTGSGRAASTNAVVTDGFDERVFLGLSYKRAVFLTSRAQKHCAEVVVLDAVTFSPEDFLADCGYWIDHLQDLFWTENDNRKAYNAAMTKARKKAKAAGSPLPEFQRRAPLQDLDWPAPPFPDVWRSSPACEDPVNLEALRVANGCIQLLNYWQDIENDRLKKSRSYLKGVGGPVSRPWPTSVESVADHV